MKRILLMTCLPLLAQAPPKSIDPAIKRIVDEVSEERIAASMKKLESFGTRHILSATDDPARGTGAARQWLFEEFRSYSPRLEVSYDKYQVKKQGRLPRAVELVNVIAVLPGTLHKDRHVIVSGHYDSLNSVTKPGAVPTEDDAGRDEALSGAAPFAPGVTDDASGVAAVLELARVMSRHEFEKTIVFIAFDGEEVGLQIEAVLNNDRRLAKGLTFNASYTFAKSIDNNSVGSSNPQIQNFYNIAAERALSDFDARHRFVLSGVYMLPFSADHALMKRLVGGWSVSPIVKVQSGNPFSPIVPLTATLAPGATPAPGAIYNSGSLLGFDRPNYVAGQPLTVSNPSPSQWINPQAFVRQNLGFGNAGRNILTAPGFFDVDFSVAKITTIHEGVSIQFRAEAFNILNHPNFGQPVQTQNSPQFGQIIQTRTARGDLGSSRQLQLGIKLIF